MSNNTTTNIKKRLQKINLLFNIFEKEGLESLSAVEKSLLLEQIELLKKAVLEVEENHQKQVGMTLPKEKSKEEAIIEKEKIKDKPISFIDNSIEFDNTDETESRVQETHDSKPSESVNETISAQLRNMRDVIDLNRSFIFKSELFDNDFEAYNNFIDQLNAQMTEEDAINLVHEYASKNAWDKEEKVFALLLRTVEKRFLPLLG